MSSEIEEQPQDTTSTGGIKRHHSIEHLDSVKEAKVDSTEESSSKTNGTNGHHHHETKKRKRSTRKRRYCIYV